LGPKQDYGSWKLRGIDGIEGFGDGLRGKPRKEEKRKERKVAKDQEE